MQFSIGILVLLVIVGAGASDESCPKFCPSIEAPVCGTDGETYKNSCKLRDEACRGFSVELAHRGPCKMEPCETKDCKCETKNCKFGARCQDVRGRIKCACLKYIPTVRDPVCGTDGKTYVNEFALERAMCRAQKRIEITRRGQCEGGGCFDCFFAGQECGEVDGELMCVYPKKQP